MNTLQIQQKTYYNHKRTTHHGDERAIWLILARNIKHKEDFCARDINASIVQYTMYVNREHSST